MKEYRFPRWTQTVDGQDYLIIVVPAEWAPHWAAAFDYAEYEGLTWTIRRNNWLVGCKPSQYHRPSFAHQCPSFEDIEMPGWAAACGE